ncbi:MAG TPA: small ribosomal subunit Rsm22 family protein [Candidatus Saccharimonadales bacterium]|jgi:ribosomal protein RSM22 (predicted rRNA methylase)|nr:small ribosomal subunit Rsm22 family protein [Candidatus Saccharimonadales bacterium]
MRLPEDLSQAIEREIEGIDHARLKQAVAQLTARYQDASFTGTRTGTGPAIASEALRAAYLAVRLPATYATITRVLGEVARLAPQVEVGSLLDLGSGPGTALHAVAAAFPSVRQITAIESNADLTALAKRLGAHSTHEAVRDARWIPTDLRSGVNIESHDLVVLSYVLGELPSVAVNKVLADAWAAAREFLVIIEPGTKRGFGTVHAVRSWLIAAGVPILAPCPHSGECPMAAAGDWCHFPARVERTSMHRRLKSGALGHEDEKFSYIVASRRPWIPAAARIVRHPQKNRGFVRLQLCTPQGLEIRTVTRSQKDLYKPARNSEWGGGWEGQYSDQGKSNSGRSGHLDIG